MEIERLRSVYVAPYQWRDRKFYGGIEEAALSEYGRLSAGKAYFRDVPPKRPGDSEPATILGKYLYGGPIWNHFGHALVDCLHRLWAHDDHDGIVFVGVLGLAGVVTQTHLDRSPLPTFVDEIMELIGVFPKQVIVLRHPTLIERLDVPSPGAVWKGPIKDFYRPYLSRYQHRIESRVAGSVVPKRLYYSRRHILKKGGILGSSYFEKALSENGFSIVRPEEMSIVDQFAHILKSEQLVFDEGSAVHLTELVNNVPPAMFMLPRRPRDSVFANALGQRGRFKALALGTNVSLLMDRRGNLSPNSLTFYRNPQAVFERMREFELVRGNFDAGAYWDAALSDLESSPSATPSLQESRANVLSLARQRNSTLGRQGKMQKTNTRLPRFKVVQTLLDLFPAPAYLEIGVNRGETFSNIKAARMTAVDPKFRFDKNEWAASMPKAKFCEVTSDAFFQTCSDTFDVIYLDGLHTFEQTLRDFANAIEFLNAGGIILIDDVIPSSYHAAMPNLKESRELIRIRQDPSGAWMGDVYRLVFFIERFFQQYSYATVSQNHGQTVVWKKARAIPRVPGRSVAEIAALPFERVYLDAPTYRSMELQDIIAEIMTERA